MRIELHRAPSHQLKGPAEICLHAEVLIMCIHNVFEYTVYAFRVNKAFYNFSLATATVFNNCINKCKGNFTQVAAGWF